MPRCSKYNKVLNYLVRDRKRKKVPTNYACFEKSAAVFKTTVLHFSGDKFSRGNPSAVHKEKAQKKNINSSICDICSS